MPKKAKKQRQVKRDQGEGKGEEAGMGRVKESKTRRKYSCYLSDLAREKIC